MFSKSRPGKPDAPSEAAAPQPPSPRFAPESGLPGEEPTPRPAPKPPESGNKASFLAADLTLIGTVQTSGDVIIEGTVEGDIHAFRVVLGEQSALRCEVVADDLTVRGRVAGQLSGLKVYLTSTARVSGDISHQILAIDAGAQFDGTAQRRDPEPSVQGAEPSARQARAPQAAVTSADAAKGKSTSAA
jgi:cytoskeletal protein CcmA (bactofilin family)